MAPAPRGSFGLTIPGHLCRKEFGGSAHIIGFGTNGGTVAAASDWDGPMEIKAVLPAIEGSYESVCHESGTGCFLLDLHQSLINGSGGSRKPRLERAIGVIYRPQTELASHYFQAVLPEQFDEYVWFDSTCANHGVRDQDARRPA
jgi:erythromycin esterase-like protein